MITFLFSSKRGTDNPGAGVGGNGSADLVNGRRFVAKLLRHQAEKLLIVKIHPAGIGFFSQSDGKRNDGDVVFFSSA